MSKYIIKLDISSATFLFGLFVAFYVLVLGLFTSVDFEILIIDLLFQLGLLVSSRCPSLSSS